MTCGQLPKKIILVRQVLKTTTCKHLKYVTINGTVFCGNRQHATDAADRALVVNNAEYYFSEELKGNSRVQMLT